MEENLKKIEEFIGKEALDRALEVMGILGIELPNPPELYQKDYLDNYGSKVSFDSFEDSDTDSYAILLNNKDGEDYTYYYVLDPIEIFEFKKGKLHIYYEKDGVFYEWRRDNDCESLEIHLGDKYSDVKSYFYLWKMSDLRTSKINSKGPDIISYTTTVENEKTHDDASLGNYFLFFKRFVTGKKFKYVIPRQLRDKGVADTVVRIFERPINDLVQDIRTTDQSWRFEKERNNINYHDSVAKERANRNFAGDAEGYHMRILEIEQETDKALSDVDAKEKAFEKYIKDGPLLTMKPQDQN